MSERYAAVVVGSGFGGTIVALTLANKFGEGPGRRVCVLERGQWWVSGEVPIDQAWTADDRPTIRGYLEGHGAPYGLWASPDDMSGFVKLAGASTALSPVRGVYDLRTMRNVTTISASGVGGGSLIYFNLTARPEPETYEGWAVQEGGRPLDKKYAAEEVYRELAGPTGRSLDYFDVAEDFLGVSTITTSTPLGRFKLGKSKVFQQAARETDRSAGELMNLAGLDAGLSITDVPLGIFGVGRPTAAERASLSWQTNVCERHGRCGLGCLVEARHTMSERLYEAMESGKPIDVFALCPVDSVEEGDDGSGYLVHLTDLREDPKGVARTIQAETVVLAAGTLGSTSILMRSKRLGKSRALGTRFSTNGDMFGIVRPTKEVVEPGKGPLLTSIARYRDKRTGLHEFSLEDLGIPDMLAEVVAPLLDTLAAGKEEGSFLPKTNMAELFNRHVGQRFGMGAREGHEVVRELERIGERASSLLTDAATKVRAGLREIEGAGGGLATPVDRLQNVLVLFGMGRDDSSGRLVEDGKGDLTLERPYDLEQGVYGHMVEKMRSFANETGTAGVGGLTIPFWDKQSKLELTAHPLGGCPMGSDAAQGVVDGQGRVFSGESGRLVHQGLFVADGSIIPTSLGVNPSLTICALAFRIAEEVSGDKRFWPTPWQGSTSR